jgi:hypothetical protein
MVDDRVIELVLAFGRRRPISGDLHAMSNDGIRAQSSQLRCGRIVGDFVTLHVVVYCCSSSFIVVY